MKNLKKINWKKLFLDNWVLKLASLTIAFVLWFVVIIIKDPVDDKTFTNIKVNLLNTELLTEKGMVYEILDGTDTLRSVTFEAPESILDVIEAGDIIAEADLNDLTVTNTVAIKFSCPKYSNEVTNFEGNISNVKLSIENKKSKSINIEYKISGEVAEGYLLGNISLDQNRLEIEGPESKVDGVSKAVVEVNVADSSSDISTRADIRLLDREGNIVSYDSVSKVVDNIRVTVDVLTVKEIPVEYLPVGEVAEGYLATGIVEATPQTVKVAGNAPAINNISKLTIAEELDLTDATENLEAEIDLSDYLPAGVSFADSEFDGKAYVTVYVEKELEKYVRLRADNVQFINIPEGILAEVLVEQEMPSLHVKGLRDVLSPLREATLKGAVDVGAWMSENQIETLTMGIHSLPVEFVLEEGQNQVEDVQIQVFFSRIEEE